MDAVGKRIGTVGAALSIAVCVVLFVSLTNLVGTPEQASAQTSGAKQFRLVGGSSSGESASYSFQTPPNEKTFADDCPSCEVGNAVIWAEFGCRRKAEALFSSNSALNIVETSFVLGENGKYLLEQRIWVSKAKSGRVVAARMFWIEGDDFWAVQAPTLELVKLLRASNEYEQVRRDATEAKKNWVPIINANTIGRDRCGDLTQKRVSHQ
ncbi:MAG: hypothetical protein JSS77_12230 [Acidobacteria bacterium]|nr:hypothetical protein [Acidobacteriota bacterium]